jgi:hypothetical protein
LPKKYLIAGPKADIDLLDGKGGNISQNLGTSDITYLNLEDAEALKKFGNASGYDVIGLGNAKNRGLIPTTWVPSSYQDIYGADRDATASALTGFKDYTNIASSEYEPLLNSQLMKLQQAYNTSVADQSRNTEYARNNYKNSKLNSNMSRSTIAQTGEAGIDLANNRILANMASEYSLGQNDAFNNFNANVASRAADLKNIDEQLKRSDTDRAFDQGYKKWQMQQSEEDQAFDQKYKMAALAKSGSGSSSSKTYYGDIEEPTDQGTQEKKQRVIDIIGREDIPARQRYQDVLKMYNEIANRSDKQSAFFRAFIEANMPALQQEALDEERVMAPDRYTGSGQRNMP